MVITPKDLSAQLRKYQPTALLVTIEGEKEKTRVVMGENRKRWSNAADLALSMDWTRIDGVDEKDALIFRVEQEEVPEPVRETGDLRDLTKEEANLEIMLRAQKMVLEHQTAAQSTLVEGYKALADVLTQRIFQLERHFADTLDRLRESALAVGAGEGNADQFALQMAQQLLAGKGLPSMAPPSATMGPGTTPLPAGVTMDDITKLVNLARGTTEPDGGNGVS